MTTLLEVSDVSVTFDGFRAINELSFAIGQPELRAVIGPNGAGKTTFMDIVTGKTRPDTGRVLWGERQVDLLRLSESQIARTGIGRKFQKPTVFENLTVADNVLLALAGERGVFANLFSRRLRTAGDDIDRFLRIARMLEHRGRRAGDLSHGQKQWLEIAMLLAQDPKLLLVDEPVAGMTDAETDQTADLLREIAEVHSVVVVEHDMAFVRRLGVKVTVLHEGSVLAEGSLDHVSRNERVIDVYLGR